MISKLIFIEKISSNDACKIRAMLFGFIGLGLLSIIFYPLDLLNKQFPGLFNTGSSCIMLNVFGIPCPFCGMSHSFSEFIKFNFSESIYYNPASVIFFSFLGLVCLSILALSFYNYKISVTFEKKTFLIGILVLLLMWVMNIIYGHHNF
ncbi:MAG: DUF2752 domain-containing protein [Bacteroidota bacterium]|nr:DUF2752 domain-containing protein [Bacteroidota bacterium]